MPSAKVLESKKQIVADLTEKLQNAVSGVIVNYSGITVENDTKMRAELRKAGVEYAVIKNTMTKRACENVGYGELANVLEGMTAIAISKDDAVAPAKILKEYADKVDIYKVDVDAEAELARLFKVRSIPTLVYIPTEGLPVVEMGGKGKGELREKLNALK